MAYIVQTKDHTTEKPVFWEVTMIGTNLYHISQLISDYGERPHLHFITQELKRLCEASTSNLRLTLLKDKPPEDRKQLDRTDFMGYCDNESVVIRGKSMEEIQVRIWSHNDIPCTHFNLRYSRSLLTKNQKENLCKRFGRSLLAMPLGQILLTVTNMAKKELINYAKTDVARWQRQLDEIKGLTLQQFEEEE